MVELAERPIPKPEDEHAQDGRPYSVLLRLIIALLIAHFDHETTVNQKTLEDYDKRIIKRVLSATGRELEVRYEAYPTCANRGTNTVSDNNLAQIYHCGLR
jgi:hypothetical protein